MKPLQPEEAEELALLHWMVYGTRLGQVGGTEYTFRRGVHLEFPGAFTNTVRVWEYLRRAVTRAGRLTPQGARVLVWLARKRDPLFSSRFHDVVRTVDDVLSFASAYLRQYHAIGRMAKEFIAQWLEMRLTDLDAAEHRRYSKGYERSLKDIIRLTHPTFGGPPSERIGWLLGKVEHPNSNTLHAVELISDPTVCREIKLRCLESFVVPHGLARGVVGGDKELWLAALPSLTERDVLETLPRIANNSTWTRAEVHKVFARFQMLSPMNPVRMVDCLWKILNTPDTRYLIQEMAELLLVEAGKVVPPSGRTAVFIDRSGSCPPWFFREAVVASHFSPAKLYLVDDIVEEVRGLPSHIVGTLKRFTPRGGSLLSKAVTPLIVSKERFDYLIFFMKQNPFQIPEDGELLTLALEKYRRRIVPGCTVVWVFPKHMTPVSFPTSLKDRVVYGPERLPAYLGWLRDPVQELMLVEEVVS